MYFIIIVKPHFQRKQQKFKKKENKTLEFGKI
jgi:hypothetical protein